MKRKIVNHKWLILGSLLWIVFLALYIWVRLVAYEVTESLRSHVICAVCILLGSIFSYRYMIGLLDFIEEEQNINIHFIWMMLGILYFVLGLGFMGEILCSKISVFEAKDIHINNLIFPKEYIFDIYAVIVFPLFSEITYKAMRKGRFAKKNIVQGCLQLVGMTLAGYMLFSSLSNIWMIELAVMNILTVVIGSYKYIQKSDFANNKKIIAANIGYLSGWLLLLVLRIGDKKTITEYMYGGEWKSYVENVQVLISNASLFGTSKTLSDMSAIREFLYYRNNVIHQLLLYGGWFWIIVILMIISIFLFVLIKMEDGKKHLFKKHFLIHMTALGIFGLRIFMGVFFSFALIPYSVWLPFSGSKAIYTDTIVFAILLISAYENTKINEIYNLELVEASEFFKDTETFDVIDRKTGESYNEDFLEKKVLVKNKEESLACMAMWLYGERDDYTVLETVEGKVFILEYDDDEWIVAKDKCLVKELYLEYKDIKLSQFME